MAFISSPAALPNRAYTTSEPELSARAIGLDMFERIVIALLFGQFALQMWHSYSSSGGIIKLLLLISEVLPFLLIIVRRPSMTLSQRPGDWLFGLSGSLTPLLLVPVDAGPLLPGSICLALVIAGMFIQISAKVILGRSFGIVAANRGVKIAGPYRFVRHPMYAGYTVAHIGSLLAMPSVTNAAIYAGALCFQIVRILREEKVLARDANYRGYAAQVKYRLLPGIF